MSLILVVLIPLVAAVLVALAGSWPNFREAISLLAGTIIFFLVLSLLPTVLAGESPSAWIAEPIPGLPIALRAEPLGTIFGLTASFLWVVTTVYSIGYLRRKGESNQSRFYAFFAIAIAATMGVAFAENLFTLFLFY